MSQYYDAFISYGRADSKAFATQLYKDLTEAGFKVWFDQNDIPLGVDFQNQIDDGIERAHNFLFIIAPHSINSPYCLKEIELAVKYKKRIIPLLHVEQITTETWQERNPGKTETDWEEYREKGLHSSFDNMHGEIGRINWVYFRENVENYDKSLANLIKLFHQNEDCVQKHTQILVKALEWERNKKLTRYLLVGKERQEAKEWLKIEFKNEQPPCLPTDLQCEFICESIKNANNLMTKVFLSYSEKNRSTMERVRKFLMRHGITVWTSQTDIKIGSEFQQAINRGIEGADNLVFLLSPESLKSEYCRQELALAFSLNKRIISLLIEPTELEKIPPELQKLQFINLTLTKDKSEYQKILNNLIKELGENAVYYQQHKVLLVKALKWEEQKQNPSLLLRGYNLDRYQSWLQTAGKKQLHPPTDLQREFIAESAKQPPDLTLDVFVSYSRADSDFTRRLNDALQTQGKNTWFDQESIATGTDFQAEIYRGIEQSDNFLFVISPYSVNSPYCADEVEYARSLNKRFVTVLHRQVNSGELHPELAKVQWLDFNRYGGDFYANFSELVRTLDLDREYVREHTKKSQMALEWQRGGKSADFLLRGTECARGYEWFRTAQKQNKRPAVTEDIKKFIIQSRRVQRRQKTLTTAALLGTIAFLSGLSVVAWGQKLEAERQKLEAQQQSQIALSRQLVAESRTATVERGFLQRGTLLAVESIENFQKLNLPLVAADTALRRGLSLLPDFISEMNENSIVRALAFSPDGKYLATASEDNTARVWDAITGKEVAKLNHGNRVRALAFSPDGKYLATASDDNTARVWLAATGREVAKLNHRNRVNAVAFSSDGKYLATASDDNTARVWLATTGQEVAKLNHDGPVNDVAFSPDDKYLATASSDYTARVWDATTGEELTKLKHDGWVRALAFSPDDKYLATASYDNTARVWDATTGKKIVKIKHDGWVDAVAFSNDGKYLATGSLDKTVRVWDITTGKEVAKLRHDDDIEAVAFSPDSKYLGTASSDNTARVWDVTTGEEVAKLNQDGPVNDVAFSNDGKYLATASKDKIVRVWNATTAKEVAKLNHDAPVNDVAFSPDDKYFATASKDNTARVWDATTGKEIAKLNQDAWVKAVAFSPDGKYLATASYNNTVWVWDTTTGKEIAKLNQDDYANAVAFSPDGKYLATASSDNTARVWDATTGNEVAKLNHDKDVNAVAFSPDSKYLATASEDNTVRVWDATTGNEVAKLNHDNDVNAVAFSPDGKYLGTASSDNTARVWDATTGKEVAKLNHDNDVNAVAFSSDGKYLGTASYDNTARVWLATTGNEVAKVNHDGSVNDVAFSPDGKYLATASYDSTARVWLATTGQEVAKLNHDGYVNAVAFSSDGKYLATASKDNTVRVHLYKPQDLIKEACRRLRRNLTVEEWERYMNLDLNQYDKTCDNLPVHPSVLATGRWLAKKGEVKEAAAIFRRVLELEPDIDLDPNTEEIDNDPEAVARRLAGD